MKNRKIIGGLMLALFALASCDSWDCTLYNTVECNISFLDSTGTAVKIKDTLSVYDLHTDSLILNRAINYNGIGIPLSNYRDADTLLLKIWNDTLAWQDTLAIEKTNMEFFESIDCPVKVFHTITKAEALSHNYIDTVLLTSPKVEFNNGENIQIYVCPAGE